MAIIIHVVQKLLNTSRVKASLFVSQPSANQEMHSWYAKLISTSFKGKLMVMYVHEQSLLLILTKGKTINGTLPEFYLRLEALLKRNHFPSGFIKNEIVLAREGFVISKTSNKSVLASMNAITYNIEWSFSRFLSYDLIELDSIEDSYLNWLTHDPGKPNNFRRTSDYWKEKGLIK